MIDLLHIERHHIIVSCFQNFNCHWLNNHQNSLTEFTYILRVLGSKIWPKYGSGFGKMQHILTGSGILQLPRKVDNYPGICQNLSMGCRIFFACLWRIRETIHISCKHESIRCALSGVSLQTKSLIFPLQFFEFILLFLETKSQEFEKAMKKWRGAWLSWKRSRNVALGSVSCENLYGILISNYYCSHWQAAIFLCVFVCVAVISKNYDNVKMQKKIVMIMIK